MSSAEFPTPLVSTDWLAAHLDDSSVRVLDVTMYLANAGKDAKAEYVARHISGAVFADLGWLSDETAPYPHTFPNVETFVARIEALGVGSEHRVVVYDGSGQNFSAPRLWYTLRTLGHRRVSVLDGGLKKWLAEGRPVTADVPIVASATFTANFDASRLRDIDAMRANVESRAEQVVDARSAGRFEATEPEPRAGVRGGHIPGSVNVHYAKLVNDDGTLKSKDGLRAVVEGAGLDTTKPIVASCGTGVTACAVVLALDVLGVPAAVFDGSWTEWGSATDTPIETGPAR
jgi:thiosulfate/3-mercaptopyruvate sulfurtransferase